MVSADEDRSPRHGGHEARIAIPGWVVACGEALLEDLRAVGEG
jgi:hypothetical protein